MQPETVFSTKAENYARYRWRYAAQAIRTLLELTGLNQDSCVADVGAGTGILTRELATTAGLIYAVEPNPYMRAIAVRELKGFPACRVVDGRAEATGLGESSLDLITAAQATNWFDPQAARTEFRRILKPGGWLAILRNYGTDRELGAALDEIYPPETDTAALMVGAGTPRDYYFAVGRYQKIDFPFSSHLSWDEFFGSLCTASYAPDEGSPAFARFEAGARRIFEAFSSAGLLESHGITELYLGLV